MYSPGLIFLYILVWALMVVSMWKVFEKAGKPGWAAIIPIYNTIILLEIAGKPVWWILLFLVPVVNVIVDVIVCVQIARKFGYDTGYGIGLFILPIVFMPMLGFGSAQYRA